MLVLRRNEGESLVIAGMITVKILAVEGRRVKMGIEAPRFLTVMRQELLRCSPRSL